MHTFTKRTRFHLLYNGICIIAVFLLIYTGVSVPQSHRDWSYNLGIYEVNIRQYTRAGTFTAFEEHLDRLQDMGVGILWMMPVNPIGQKNRLCSLGSYYSVRDYLSVNPEFGTMEDFKTLVQNAHNHGMYVIIDWVANHTSWDNTLTTTHPEWYSKDASNHFIAPPGTNWTDVIELDYSKQGLRDYMIDAMKFWVTETGVDGFRCDAVSMVPQDFWVKAISALKTVKPDIFMLAEGDGKEWHDAGFDMSYGWGLYGFGAGLLKQIADKANSASSINTYTTSELATYKNGAYRMYFTQNHDENSWYGTSTELFGDAAETFAVLTATFNGMPLVYSGQEAGLDKRLAFFERDPITWQNHKNTAIYTRLLHLKKENKALWNGDNGGPLRRVSTSNNFYVLAFVRQKGDDKVMAAFNLSDKAQSVKLSGTDYVGSYYDLFTDEPVSLDSAATITLPAWGYMVYSTNKVVIGVNDEPTPDAFYLGQNYPNPFNPDTTIPYTLTVPANAALTVYDLLGRQVQVLFNRHQQAGEYEYTFNAANLPTGLYFYQLQAGNFKQTRQCILLR